jgi:hypothetical protein
MAVPKRRSKPYWGKPQKPNIGTNLRNQILGQTSKMTDLNKNDH